MQFIDLVVQQNRIKEKLDSAIKKCSNMVSIF